MKNRSDVEIRTMLNEVRRLYRNNMLTEDDNNNDADTNQESGENVPYTMQDQLMSSIVETARTQFGADFSNSKNPMLYYPDSGDVTLSGTIRDLNDAKFQFRYKDSNGGCYIWISPLLLNDDNIKTLSVISGVYKNWKKELSGNEDIKPMSLRNTPSDNGQNDNAMVPGDDF